LVTSNSCPFVNKWIKGKSFDTFAPLGPVLVTSSDIPDPQNLRVTTRVNGEFHLSLDNVLILCVLKAWCSKMNALKIKYFRAPNAYLG
jgi:2-keto-4-pentenoate hydratase/2-oxohepta-3-ene-1,7-dioic acid hydratase in catechol pathway